VTYRPKSIRPHLKSSTSKLWLPSSIAANILQRLLSPTQDLPEILALISLQTSLASTLESSSIFLAYRASGEVCKIKTLFVCWNLVGTSTVTLPYFSISKF